MADVRDPQLLILFVAAVAAVAGPGAGAESDASRALLVEPHDAHTGRLRGRIEQLMPGGSAWLDAHRAVDRHPHDPYRDR